MSSPLIPHSRPLLPDDFAEVAAHLTPGWVADGPTTRRFEERAARVLGWEQGVATSSGTAALHLALLALGVGPGDEVVIPAYVCTAVLNAVLMTGASPVAADCEADGYNLCPADVRRRLTPRTKAVVVAHLFGERARVEELVALGVPVIEDCAQSFGARRGGRPVGSDGALAISSFYATKVITTGVGGLIAGPPELTELALDRREYDHREDWKLRFGCKMDELSAALGLWQLDHLGEMMERRRLLARRYAEKWASLPAAQRKIDAEGMIYRYTLRDAATAEPLLQRLRHLGVDAKRPVNSPLSRVTGHDCPAAERAFEHILSVPLYPALTDAEAERVIQAVERALAPVDA